MPDNTRRRRALPIIGGQGVRSLPRYLITDNATIYEELDATTGWSVPSGTMELNTTDFVSGTGSIKLTSAVGTSTYLEKAGSWNFSGKSANIAVWVYLHSAVTTLSAFMIYMANDAGFTNHFYCNITTILHTGWNVINPATWTVGAGAPSWDNPIVRIRLRESVVAGQTGITSWDRLEAGGTRRPAVVLSFDDGGASVYTQAYQIMKQRKLVGTAYMIGNSLTDAISLAQLQEMEHGGWAIANHTQTHTDLTTLSQADAQTELTNGKNTLDAAGFTANSSHVAYPVGNRNATVVAAMQAAGMLTGRAVAGNELEVEYAELYNLSGNTHDNTVSLATSKGRIDTAVSTGKVAFMLFHILAASAGAATWAISDFTALMDYIVSQNVQSLTIGEFYRLRSGSIMVNHR